jgi:polyketide synthase PksJ
VKDKRFQNNLNIHLNEYKDHTSIQQGEHAITYGQLNMSAGHIADWIATQGMENHEPVGVFSENRSLIITAIIGILKAGKVFVPLDTANPHQRQEQLIRLTGLKHILTDETTHEKYIERPIASENNVRLQRIEKLLEPRSTANRPTGNTNSKISYAPEDPIYIYFTSGTTGLPKGVVGKNKSLTHYSQWEVEAFNFKPHQRFSQMATPGFDAFLKEVFVTLFAGGTLYIPQNPKEIMDPETLLHWMKRNRIEIFHGVPGIFRLLNTPQQTPENLQSLKYVLLSGEPIQPSELKHWYEVHGERIRLVNLYGTTETTILSSSYNIRPEDVDRKRIPIGKPIKGTRLIILNENMGLCAKGEVGEIYIRTPYRTHGYYKDPEQNRRRFVPNPFNPKPEDIIFRTGDRGRMLPDENIEVLGRMDRQVKIRGIRIELEEIESRLQMHPAVTEAAVIKRRQNNQNEMLCAYIKATAPNTVKDEENRDNDINNIRNNIEEQVQHYLKETLPEYITVATLTVMEKIPKKANGKIDYDTLPDPLREAEQAYEAPGNDEEHKLAEIWAEVLGIEDITTIGIKTPFFHLGGNSLNSVTLAAKINRAYNIEFTLPEIFAHPTITEQVEQLRRKQAGNVEPIRHRVIEATEEKEFYALTSAQRRIYILHRMTDETAYNMPVDVIMKGELDVEALEQAFQKTIERHESLRTAFRLKGDEPVQYVLSPGEISFALENYDIPRDGNVEEITKNFRRPFDLSHPPLIRVGLVKTGQQEHRLMMDLHHIISDGVSQAKLVKDAAALYRDLELPPMQIQYKDYAQWEQLPERQEKKKRREDFWLNQFSGELPVLNLPADNPRPQVQSFEGNTVDFHFSTEETAAIKAMAKEYGVTIFMIQLAFFNIMMSKLSGQEDILVGTPVAARKYPELNEIIGMFVNTLVLRNKPEPAKNLGRFIKEIGTNTLEAFENQEYPFEELVDQLTLPRDTGRNPLFDVMFMQKNFEMPTIEMPGLTLQPVKNERSTAKFDLTLSSTESATRLYNSFEYSTRLFKEETIQRFITYYKKIVQTAISKPDTTIGDIEIITEEEKRRHIIEFNATETEFPADRTLTALFEEQATRYPQNIALETENAEAGTQQITYRELNCAANRLAHAMMAKGVTLGNIVGIAIPRCIDMVIGIIAILKTGAAYLPIEMDYPKARIRYLIADSDTDTILTDKEIPPHIGYKGTTINITDTLQAQTVDTDPEPQNDPGNPAYVIYTSGTTGKPKGVLLCHRAVVNYIDWAAKTYVKNETAAFPLHTSISFDLTVTSLYTPLLTGNKIIVYGKEEKELIIEEMMRENKAGVMKVTPAHLKLIRDLELNADIKRIIVGGEELETKLAADITEQFGSDTEIYNEYGPTEAAVGCMIYRYTPGKDKNNTVPIGTPIQNTQIYILDKNLGPVPTGAAGELYIAGSGLAEGYLNNPELTAQRFISYEAGNTESTPGIPTTRLYKTGDQARMLPNGNIEFLGRFDHQVKIRGYRIEMGEVENKLQEIDGVRDALLVVKSDQDGEKYLSAYITPENPDALLEQNRLKEQLAQEIPGYMIPAHITQIEKIPLTTNGKVDRNALPEPELRPTRDYTPPENEAEEILVQLWAEVLGRDKDVIGIDENFFDLGGNSMKSIRLNNRMKAEFNKEIPLVTLFRYTTIRTMASHLNSSAPPARPTLKTVTRQKIWSGDTRLAVIGMAGRFPGAANVAEFWENLVQGKEAIATFTEDELIEAGHEPAIVKNPNYVKAVGILEDKDHFDSAFFGYMPEEAGLMDPQTRQLHETAWEALEDAGICPENTPGLIGLYAGASPNFGWQAVSMLSGETSNMGSFAAKHYMEKDFINVRISYKLNLNGPSVSIYTACSTSLVTIHMASRALQAGDCDIALAGGVTISHISKGGYMYQEGMILSPDGHCRAFDAEANGTIGGEGSALVVLKRLDEALRDGDNIHAVLLGTAINNDGDRKAGFTAPSIEGQAEVIQAAMQEADVSPETVTYVEAHGTGTNIGDPIEIEGLKLAFNTQKKQYCTIGAVKTNVGHLDSAAGAAGFIKTVLALKHKVIPPTVHYKKPNPVIDFENSPFKVSGQLTPWKNQEWKNEEVPLRAGVSSFGIGGTNAHVILEEAPHREPTTPGKTYQLLMLSARNTKSLDTMTRNLKQHLESKPDTNMADVAYTLQTGRRAFPCRRILAVKDNAEAVAILEDPTSERIKTATATNKPKRIVYMFPGQGAQYVNMGKELYDEETIFRQEIDRSFEILKKITGVTFKEILYPDADNPDATERINQTQYTQPLLFVFEYALAKQLTAWGIKPDIMIGHSIGEYVAATLSGILTLEDALNLVAKRGALMGKLPGGSMLSVAIAPGKLEPYLKDRHSTAAVNGPQATVVSGEHGDIDRLEARLTAEGIECRRLHTSHAFHSAMMDPILEEYRQEVEKVEIRQPSIPYISNVTGKPITTGDLTDPGYWSTHIRGTVRFYEGAKHLEDTSGTLYLEIGPGKTLTTFIRQQLAENRLHKMVNMVRHPKEQKSDRLHLQEKLGELWLYGTNPDWEKYYDGQQRRKVQLPTYPFEKTKYPSKGDPVKMVMDMMAAGSPVRKTEISDWFYIPTWKRMPLPISENETKTGLVNLLYIGRDEIGLKWAEDLRQKGDAVVIATRGTQYRQTGENTFIIDPANDDDTEKMIAHLAADGKRPHRVLHLWSVTGSDNSPLTVEKADEAQQNGYYSILSTARAIGNHTGDETVEITVVTDNMQDIDGTGPQAPEKATIQAAIKAIQLEYDNITTRCIDIRKIQAAEEDDNRIIRHLNRELQEPSDGEIVAYRGNSRWIQTMEPVQIPRLKNNPLTAHSNQPKPGNVYLVTGGLGGMGLEFAHHLAKTAHTDRSVKGPKIILTGRRPMPDKNQWREILEKTNTDQQTIRIIEKLQQIEKSGAEIHYIQADISNLTEMETKLKALEEKLGPVAGIIHTAGIADHAGVIHRRSRKANEDVFAPKIAGTLVLDAITKDRKLDFMVLCSSLSAVLTPFGQVGYSAANLFQDAYAAQKRAKENAPVVSIGWEAWQEVGMAVEAARKQQPIPPQHQQRGLKTRDAIEIFNRALQQEYPHLVISTVDLPKLMEHRANEENSQNAAEDKVEETEIKTTRPELTTAYAPPNTPIEKEMSEMWQKYFGYDRVGINDDFFELGGDSLKANIMVSKLHKTFAVKIPLSEIFNSPTIKKIAAYMQKTNRQDHIPVEPVEKREYYPLSRPQKRLYFLQQMDENSTAFNMPQVTALEENPDTVRLENAFNQLLKRHESLRTTFLEINREPVQKIHNNISLNIEYIETDDNRQTQQVLQNFVRPFDLTVPPLIRVGVIKSPQHVPYLAVDIHHTITDGTSQTVLIKEFMALYNGETPPTPTIHYKDFSHWQNRLYESGEIKKQEQYWLKQFEHRPPQLNLPFDFPRPEIQSNEGSSIKFRLEKEKADALKALARQEESTMYILLLALFNVLLAKLSRQDDIVVGTISAGRRHADLEQTIGLFVNVLPMRSNPAPEKTFSQYLEEVKESALHAFENQDYQFEDLVAKIGGKRDLSRHPLYDAGFTLQNMEGIPQPTQTQEKEGPQYTEIKQSRIDISLVAMESQNTITFDFEYCRKLFKKETMETFIENFKTIIAEVMSEPQQTIRRIDITPEDQKIAVASRMQQVEESLDVDFDI